MIDKPARKTPRMTGEGRLPGDLTKDQMIERMIRVDHAGEYGAVRIYEGQLAVLGNTPSAPIIKKMAKQEERHLKKFNELIA
ncbi:MAG: demethoxyubiquinone hydroxylase family protein, partial [Rhodospirillaceae bacterium]|nr:demethoxyubiquinone hydroxylase family protein [Rhodospirillaceae bacterium]